MPVFIAPDDFSVSLAASTPANELQAILARADATDLTAYPASPRVNSVKNDDAACIVAAKGEDL